MAKPGLIAQEGQTGISVIRKVHGYDQDSTGHSGFVSMLMDISYEIIRTLLPVYLMTVLGTSLLMTDLTERIAEATAAITKAFYRSSGG